MLVIEILFLGAAIASVLAIVFLPTLWAARRIWLGRMIRGFVEVRRFPVASSDEWRRFAVVTTLNIAGLVVSAALHAAGRTVLGAFWVTALAGALTIPQWRSHSLVGPPSRRRWRP